MEMEVTITLINIKNSELLLRIHSGTMTKIQLILGQERLQWKEIKF